MTSKLALVPRASPWIDTLAKPPTSEKHMYWVHFPDGAITLCYFNDYSQYGGPVNYWQTLNHDDLPMYDTKYIAIIKPNSPK